MSVKHTLIYTIVQIYVWMLLVQSAPTHYTIFDDMCLSFLTERLYIVIDIFSLEIHMMYNQSIYTVTAHKS